MRESIDEIEYSGVFCRDNVARDVRGELGVNKGEEAPVRMPEGIIGEVDVEA